MTSFGIIVFPGSNCDRDIATVTAGLLNQPTRFIWHQEADLQGVDVVVLPGGFSYGDYLRCGAIARFSPIMAAIIDHAKAGKRVLGICNGFQVLTEVGLLPGALIRNRDLHFICDRVTVRVESNHTLWTQGYQSQQVITLPIAHGEGRYFADEDTLKALEDNGQILFRYSNAQGELTAASNPNGSLHHIAGITNGQGNVLGMMPHPERAADRLLKATDGLAMFIG
ncbi:phosphoribosylformylglycinamidine synthase subunit PurQ [Synechocystis sp. PCC 7339]|uniref:phosphoribosylformylglycinamidine synthase subunit PurQ n=1 Tax=unclassified Synechocystis TaxID=2640012 RepID=UPI001BAEE75E|nr:MULTISPECIES: phosphoribosylformylglycinamidine synthase subunit PurQ [unclassified Synechocystis]QUS60910.1 phosphoribosylformylglycinamidine synthase subunit PurQ [Synechocystis sp. PCC 7338]UAJ73094.1 phosphoribosylformylglycinamidine synthase subunit PurQ [Synechocystis sp. PCC 7339]